MTLLVIPIANQHSYAQIPRNKDLKLTIANHCNAPSKQLVIDWKGDCFVCGCEAWLPISVGTIDQFEQLSDIWTSSTAQELQQHIDSKVFTHCAVDRCGILNGNKIDDKHVISINIDESCNLSCPSCRKEHILMTAGTKGYDLKLSQVNHIIKLLEQFEEPCHIVMSGNGDPLASTIMRPLIRNFVPKKNQTIRLFTNGLLMEKQLDDSTILTHVTEYFISIDAGSQSVYEQVRRPGKWINLVSNLNWLKTAVVKTRATVLLKFVLQSANWHDMRNFCELCIQYKFNGVINRLENWGTWAEFDQEDVIGNSDHNDHVAVLEELKSVYALYKHNIQFNSSLIQLATETN